MGVMNTMRANMAGIMIFLVVAFVLTMSVGGLVGGADIMDVITGDKSDSFTVVNGEEITREAFVRAVQNEREAYRQQNQAEMNEQQLDQLTEQVWETMVSQTLIAQEVDKFDIEVTDEELRYYFSEGLHPIIQSNFSPEGVFDYDLYSQAVNDPQYAPLFNYWRQQIASVVPVEKLQQQIFATAHVSEAELYAEFLRQNQIYDIEYLFIRSSLWQDDEFLVTEEEIQNYYDENIEEYQQVESRVVDFVSLPLTPTLSDSQRVLSLVEDIMSDIKAGESFESQAQIHSIDPSANDGGYLGWFGRGRMVKPFEDASFGAQPGDLVGPVLTQFGYHLIKVEDKRTTDGREEVEARHILMDIKPSETTRNDIRRELRNLEFTAEEVGFDKAVDSLGFTMATSNKLKDGDSYVAGLGQFASAVRFAFRGELEEFSSLLQNDKALAVFRLKEIIPAGPRPLEEVTRGIERRLLNDAKLKAASTQAEELRSSLSSETEFSSVSMEREGLAYEKVEAVRSTASIKGLGRIHSIYGYLAEAEAGSISQAIETNRGYVIIKLIAKSELDEQKFMDVRESLKETMMQTRRNDAWTQYLEDLRNEAKIIDNRQKFL